MVVFVEVKHDSSLGEEQLERYWEQLQRRATNQKQLVLLTRSKHSVQETSLPADQYRSICWYQISALLSEINLDDEVSKHAIEGFLEFLAEKGMSMEKIERDYIRGVPALRNLANMIGTAMAEAFPEVHTRRTAGWSWIGYYFSGKSWVGLWYDDPMNVLVEKDSADDPKPNRRLDLEARNFFSLTAGEQLELLISFIASSVKDLDIDLDIEPANENDLD